MLFSFNRRLSRRRSRQQKVGFSNYPSLCKFYERKTSSLLLLSLNQRKKKHSSASFIKSSPLRVFIYILSNKPLNAYIEKKPNASDSIALANLKLPTRIHENPSSRQSPPRQYTYLSLYPCRSDFNISAPKSRLFPQHLAKSLSIQGETNQPGIFPCTRYLRIFHGDTSPPGCQSADARQLLCSPAGQLRVCERICPRAVNPGRAAPEYTLQTRLNARRAKFCSRGFVMCSVCERTSAPRWVYRGKCELYQFERERDFMRGCMKVC